MQAREKQQQLARDEVAREKASLERAMKMQNQLEAERARILREKAEGEAAEKFLREQTVRSMIYRRFYGLH